METKDDISGFGRRLKEAFGGARNSVIAERSGISNSAITKYLEGRLPDADVLIKMAAASGVSIHWLLTGEGPRVTGDSPGHHLIYLGEYEESTVRDLARETGRTFDDEVRELVLEGLRRRGLVASDIENIPMVFFGDQAPDLIEIPLIGTISAGRPLQMYEEFETITVPAMFRAGGKEVFALRVTGDSMIDEGVLSGDVIICSKATSAYNGQKAIVLIDGSESTLKKIFREGKRIRLQPANAKYPPLILEPERVVIQGTVIGIYRPA